MPMPRRRLSLWAIEVDGDLPPCVELARDGVHGTIIVAQRPAESAAKFAARLVDRIERARSDGSTIARASLACSARSDVEAIAARILVVRTMLAKNPDLCHADVAMTSSSFALRHQLEAIRETFREHGLGSAPVAGELDVAPATAAPLQRVA
jgi:hypothetical protein